MNAKYKSSKLQESYNHEFVTEEMITVFILACGHRSAKLNCGVIFPDQVIYVPVVRGPSSFPADVSAVVLPWVCCSSGRQVGRMCTAGSGCTP